MTKFPDFVSSIYLFDSSSPNCSWTCSDSVIPAHCPQDYKTIFNSTLKTDCDSKFDSMYVPAYSSQFGNKKLLRNGNTHLQREVTHECSSKTH